MIGSQRPLTNRDSILESRFGFSVSSFIPQHMAIEILTIRIHFTAVAILVTSDPQHKLQVLVCFFKSSTVREVLAASQHQPEHPVAPDSMLRDVVDAQ